MTSAAVAPSSLTKVAITWSIYSRSIYSSPVKWKSAKSFNPSNRQVKILNKLMFGRNKGKKWYDSDPGLGQFSSVKAISNPIGVQKHTSRRVSVLNKLFMKNITDMMATGEVSEEFLGKGVEISRVKVAPDFQNVNVYWLAKGSENDAELALILRKCSGILRHELSQLRVMGEVPRINFVKDIEFAKYVEVERLLKDADLGNEAEETNEIEDVSEVQNVIPEMRNDVLGLDHGAILGRVQEKLKISKIAWQNYEAKKDTQAPLVEDSLDLVELKRQHEKEREEKFELYLEKKRIEKGYSHRRRMGRDYSSIVDNNTEEDDEIALRDEPDDFDEEFYKNEQSKPL